MRVRRRLAYFERRESPRGSPAGRTGGRARGRRAGEFNKYTEAGFVLTSGHHTERPDMRTDEELARRLDQQLNRVPAAASRKRTRKLPDFYVPEVRGSKGGRQKLSSSPLKEDDSDASSRDDSWKPEDKDDGDDADFKPQAPIQRSWDADMGPSGEYNDRLDAAQQSGSIDRSQNEERSHRERKSKGLRELQALINDAHKVGHRSQRSSRSGMVQPSTNGGEQIKSSPSSGHSHSGDRQCPDNGQEQTSAHPKQEVFRRQSQAAGSMPLPGPIDEQRQARALKKQSQNGISAECPGSGIQQKSCASGGQQVDAPGQCQKHGAVKNSPRKRQRLDDASADSHEPTRSRNTSTSQAGNTKASVECSTRKPVKQEIEKLPRMPMVLHNKEWYRARILREEEDRIFVEFTGFEDGSFVKPFWLSKDSGLIWRGSYRGKDWKYLGDGAWEPRVQGGKKRAGKRGRCPQGRRRAGEDESDDNTDPKQNGYTEEIPQRSLSVSRGRLRPNGKEDDANGSESAQVPSQTSDNEDRSQSCLVGSALRCDANADGPSLPCGRCGPGVGNGHQGAVAEVVEDSPHQEVCKDLRWEKENQAVEDGVKGRHPQPRQNSQDARRQRQEDAKRHGCMPTEGVSGQSPPKVIHTHCDVNDDVNKEAAKQAVSEAEEQEVSVSDVVVCKVVQAEDNNACCTTPSSIPTGDDQAADNCKLKALSKGAECLRDSGCIQEQRASVEKGSVDGKGCGKAIAGHCQPLRLSSGQGEGIGASGGLGSRDSVQEDGNRRVDGQLTARKKIGGESGNEEDEHSGIKEDTGEQGLEVVASSATLKTGLEESPTKAEAAHGDPGDGEEGTLDHLRRSERVKRLGWKGAWKRSCKSGRRSGSEDDPVATLGRPQPASPVSQQQSQQQRIRTSKRIAAQAAANEASKKTGGDTKPIARAKSGPLRRTLTDGELCKSPKAETGPADPLRHPTKSHRLKSHRSLPTPSTQHRGYTSVVGRSMTHALAMTSGALHWTAHNTMQRHIRRHLPYYTGHISDEKLGAFVELMEHLDGSVRSGNSGTPWSTPSHSQSDSQAAGPSREQDGLLTNALQPSGGNVQRSAGFRQPGQAAVPLPWGAMHPMICPVAQFPMSVPGMELLHKPQGRASAAQPGAQASQDQTHVMSAPHPTGTADVHSSTAR
eukprot:evm.model.scf_2401.1 EVM.evm.TU.scf_2401.1   scf_2401:494-15580(-)